MFKKLVASAVFAGFIAGLVAAALQLAFVQPVLLKAELYETGVLVHMPQSGGHDHSAAAKPAEAQPALDHTAHGHTSQDHGDVTLQATPIDIKRDGLSLLFTIFNYTSFGLFLVAGFAFAESRGVTITARAGILWGLAGFISLQFAPAFGLPPELPGTAAADVIARQIWWVGTAVSTALGLGLLAFGKGWSQTLLAAVLILGPHVIGAPNPETLTGTPPPELASLFASRALGVGLMAWAVLGYFAAYFWQNNAKTFES